jgi:hypothetical protein
MTTRRLPNIRGTLHNDGRLRVVRTGKDLMIDVLGHKFISGVTIPLKEIARGR